MWFVWLVGCGGVVRGIGRAELSVDCVQWTADKSQMAAASAEKWTATATRHTANRGAVGQGGLMWRVALNVSWRMSEDPGGVCETDARRRRRSENATQRMRRVWVEWLAWSTVLSGASKAVLVV